MDLDTAPLVKSSQILYATPFSPRIFLNNSRDFNGCLHTARAPFSSGRCNRDAAHIFRNSFASLRRFISLWKIIWSCAIGCKGGNVVTLFSTVRYFSSRIFAKYKLFRFLWNPVERGGNGFWSENVTFYRNEISRNCCFLTYKLMKRKICKRWIENFHIFDPLLFPSLNEVVWINCRKLISERFWEVILTRIRVDRAITRRRRVWVCASKRQPPMRVSEEGGKRKAKYESRKNKMAAFLIPFHPTKSFSYIFLQ